MFAKAVQQRIAQDAKQLWRDIVDVTLTLYKITIPMLIVIKLVESVGGIDLIGQWLAPIMQWMGLPGEAALVWATTMVVNMYAGMIILVSMDMSLTVAQMTILSMLMLLAHALTVEAAIVKKAGVSILATLFIRVGGALIIGILLHHFFTHFQLLTEPAELVWQPELSGNNGLLDWAISQAESLVVMFVIIAALMTALHILKVVGIEALMVRLLGPILKILSISPKASNLTIVGITLGIAFGGGLLIKEAKAGHISPRDVFITVTLLNLLHSLIEDTLLVLLLGADLMTVLWGRIVFALIVTALVAFALRNMNERHCEKWLYSK